VVKENAESSFEERIVKEARLPAKGFGECHGAILRADIWIYRPGGSVCGHGT
jgi:hypothetical protein